jgi:hypothetical protein
MPPLVLPYERVVAFQYEERTRGARLLTSLARVGGPGDAAARGYAPHRRLRPSPQRLARARRLLPAPARRRSLPAEAAHHDLLVDFDAPAPGSGWEQVAPPRPDGTAGLRSASTPGRRLPTGFVGHPAQAWTLARRATLELPLLPGSDLEVELRVTHVLSAEVFDQLGLEVDGRAVPLTREPHPGGGMVFRAHVPVALRRAGSVRTELALTVDELLTPKALGPSPDERQLGVLVEWLHVFAVAPPSPG